MDTGDDSFEGSGNEDPPPDCAGTVSGAISGPIEHCTQTMVTETPSGEVTHGFVAVVGDQQVTIVFEFESEPPAAGTYDSTNLKQYQATIGLLAWNASWSSQYDDVPEGSMTLHLTGGSGASLVGTLQATALPLLVGEDGGNVEISLTFPP